MKKRIGEGFDYLWCALYACAAFAIELLLVFIEGIIGIDTSNYTALQNIVHWIITTVLWIGAGFLVIHIGKKTTGFDIWEHREKIKKWQYLALFLTFVINIIAKYLDWNGFKVLIEWNSKEPVLFIFQYLYYLAEGFLISLVIVFAQKAFEKWFIKDFIPYGGIVLGLVWGLAHIVSKGSVVVGIFSMLSGFLFGTAYLFVNRDYRKALPLVALLFIL